MKTPGNVASYAGTILRFCDGDTVVCTLDLGFGITLTKPVRLVNVDSWENAGDDAGKCERARRELTNTFHNDAVTIVPATKGLDRYGRIRGHVLHRTNDLGAYIVANGYGWASQTPRTNTPPPEFAPFQHQATKRATQEVTAATISEVSQ